MLKQLLVAAKAGRTLPRLSILLMTQIISHVCYFSQYPQITTSDDAVVIRRNVSLFLMAFNIILHFIGYVFLLALYKHSVQHIFNRRLPSSWSSSFTAHLCLLRPLEILWRFLTYRWRVLPDVLVLGEVRCGTTSFCEHLLSLQQQQLECHAPFCLWAHPELDRKETFFFVGHYLTRVTPRYYRMCFPLKLTKWWVEWDALCQIRRWFGSCLGTNHQKDKPATAQKSFFTFDGSAQYLTSPTAPHLIAQAYREANQPPPVLVACVRNPIDQTISWWNYENNAMDWGAQMGFTEWNTDLRTVKYPPNNIEDALLYSRGLEESYQKAERLFSGRSKEEKKNNHASLPPWAMTWPGGQLSGIGRNGMFASNIQRYESVFSDAFAETTTTDTAVQQREHGKTQCDLRYVNVLPIEYLSDRSRLNKFFVTILKKAALRKHGAERKRFQSAVDQFHYHSTNELSTKVHRNAGSGNKVKPSIELRSLLKQHFSQDSKRLEELCGVRYN